MISIYELEKDLTDVSDNDLSRINGGLTPLDSAIGAAAGGIGGALGQASYNAATNQPLSTGVPEAIGINAVFGAINPLGGAATFAGGVGRAAGGAFAGATVFDTQPASGVSNVNVGNTPFIPSSNPSYANFI
jgi:lactobin A/cerein 7B family class IIb bacteriocin